MSNGINHTTQLQSRHAHSSQWGRVQDDPCQRGLSSLRVLTGDRGINQKALLRGARWSEDITIDPRVKETWAQVS